MRRIYHKKVRRLFFFFVHLILYSLRYLTLILFIPQKRVITKVDSGPGRTNVEMIAYICVLGVYCAWCAKHNSCVPRYRSKLWSVQVNISIEPKGNLSSKI